MKASKIFTLALATGLAAIGVAKLAFSKDFSDTYGIKKTSAIGQAKCGACHVGTKTKLNVYGVDLQKAMRAEKTKILTGSVLKKVEGIDSDKDGLTNLKEIEADSLPGDPKSK